MWCTTGWYIHFHTIKLLYLVENTGITNNKNNNFLYLILKEERSEVSGFQVFRDIDERLSHGEGSRDEIRRVFLFQVCELFLLTVEIDWCSFLNTSPL